MLLLAGFEAHRATRACFTAAVDERLQTLLERTRQLGIALRL